VPRKNLAQLTFVVPLAVAYRDGTTLRRVRDVVLLGAGEGGLALQRIAAWDERRDAFSVLEDAAERAALAGCLGLEDEAFDHELARREAFLQRLVADGVGSVTAVQDEIEAFRRESAEPNPKIEGQA
jgi:hypothetical protein